MAVVVVGLFEVVEIDVQHGQRIAGPPSPGERVLEDVDGRCAVKNTGAPVHR